VKAFRQLHNVHDILVSARVGSVSSPLPWGRASQVVVASDNYYGTKHPYHANMIGWRPITFAHRSLRLLDVETLHCALCSVSTFESHTCYDYQTWSLREYMSDFETCWQRSSNADWKSAMYYLSYKRAVMQWKNGKTNSCMTAHKFNSVHPLSGRLLMIRQIRDQNVGQNKKFGKHQMATSCQWDLGFS